ncbi:mannonate dehydratase [Microbacter margulisiae]|uniref:Mannonate dehydratase n=1 Tax=Microbacter margulisiae TaxID=1350067 RepID=A0A7W5H2T9_9PORP|nr:mannonate dehydratase [Microbacter margulisiae]MBB3188135.1 mannonate dehydratase [Microbacter margulisiae]
MRFHFEQSLRWFGPHDPATLQDIRQTGASAVITALHHIPVGEVWSVDEIQRYKQNITSSGLAWHVVESVNVHEDIKRRTGNYRQYIENYKTTLRNLAACGIDVVTYNFMPVLDWVRTDLGYTLEDGSTAMYFDQIDFWAFELFVLQREGAKTSLTEEAYRMAEERFRSMQEADKQRMLDVILSGIPGEGKSFTIDYVKDQLDKYRHIDAATLRQHLILFLEEIIPVAEEAGIRMALHPDDPSFSVLGLPRIVTCENDYRLLAEAVPSLANGICFCAGSLSSNPGNDLLEMSRHFADRIHFVHLRGTQRLSPYQFYEASHLDSSVDMYQLVRSFVEIMHRREICLPMRPDHGHHLFGDLDNKQFLYGYSLLGRMKGLAELRGLETGIERSLYKDESGEQ